MATTTTNRGEAASITSRMRVLVQNIAFAILVKAVFFALTLTGFGTIWKVVFADVGTSLLVVANGLRLLRAAG